MPLQFHFLANYEYYHSQDFPKILIRLERVIEFSLEIIFMQTLMFIPIYSTSNKKHLGILKYNAWKIFSFLNYIANMSFE